MRGYMVLAMVVTAAPAAAQGPSGPTEAQLFANLGGHHRTITTKSKAAQRYFDEGLNLLFGFNHDEAIRSFQAAARLDPGCAMAQWGIAYANGPHINNPGLVPPTPRPRTRRSRRP